MRGMKQTLVKTIASAYFVHLPGRIPIWINLANVDEVIIEDAETVVMRISGGTFRKLKGDQARALITAIQEIEDKR
jgi:hypothetical protein